MTELFNHLLIALSRHSTSIYIYTRDEISKTDPESHRLRHFRKQLEKFRAFGERNVLNL